MVKFTSFKSYRTYNVFHLTFTRNPWVVIENNTLEAILRKNRSLQSHRVPRKYNRRMHSCATEAHDRTAELEAMHVCMHNRVSYQCVVHGYPCVETWPCIVSYLSARLDSFSTFIKDFSFFFRGPFAGFL
uniref:Uncharacterized protein n=1 Tax=Opuntia streptacantha TaxID=393608 RepID=A0A7C8ZHJ6_OPUST